MIRNSNGYTFVESLLQLVVLLLFVQLLWLFYPWYKEMKEALFSKEEMEWELFVFELQQDLNQANYVAVGITSKTLIYKDSESTFTIERGSNILRKLRDNQGNQPILMNVKSAYFDYFNNEVYVKVIFLNAKEKERTFIVPHPIE